MVASNALSDLIGMIYDCSIDAAQWDSTLRRMASVLGYDRLLLTLNDLRQDRLLICRSVGWDARWLEERNKHLPEIHGKLAHWLLHRTSLDGPFVATREIPAHELSKSSYYNSCLRPQGIGDVMHWCLLVTRSHFSEVVLTKQAAQGAITDEEIEVSSFLIPHLRRAMTIGNAVDLQSVELSMMSGTLDALKSGVLFADARRNVLLANRTAATLLRENTILCLRDGRLSAVCRRANDELKAAIELATTGGDPGEVGISINLTDTGQPIFAHVLSMTGTELRSRLKPSSAVAVFVDANRDASTIPPAFAAAFRLTPTEGKVLEELTIGHAPEEIASGLGVAISTVRTHIKNLFVKTGVSRQSDLIRLAIQSVPPIKLTSDTATDRAFP
ncbi:helix-turn-helix transcriptional regulator [Rhizobium mesosinicum]|uniref:Helix-turn-helix transcriptional regulator n=1 Tax=Rhizobium mesosinicum TaxID=335017 RepID=A0ABS7GMB8_9HYPH|nr:helix-turn-helix transcriptional regulator [Rhizobium mesosinicum]MBW9051119.1 helix-turn-helix transcriptional regulator [Rhizobium mesosinicum]